MHVRLTTSEDISALRVVLDRTSLFPSDLLPEMINGFLSNGERKDLWMTCEVDGKAVGFCYAVPEELADGTWNMLAIAVDPDKQGVGYGSALVHALEAFLREQGHRVLVADTSGKDEFSLTREFYRKSGYSEEARIRDFWAEGDDKVVFWKRLAERHKVDAAH